MTIEFDKTLELPFAQLADDDKVCYQPASENEENAVELAGLGWFAPIVYDEKHKDTIMAICKEWVFCEYSSYGIDQDHDNGIYDVDHDEKFVDIRPANCVLVDGKVVAVVDRKGRPYKLGNLGTQWMEDNGHGSTVDCVSYSITHR